jgi:hypothetical protein
MEAVNFNDIISDEILAMFFRRETLQTESHSESDAAI